MRVQDRVMLGTYIATQLHLNKQELATVRRAVAIMEEARDKIRADLGSDEYEYHDLYTLSVCDLEGGVVEWYR